MSITVYIALFGWIPAVLLMFMCLPPRRAVIVALIVGFLFLPVASIKFGEGIPLFNKVTATCLGVLLGSLFFDHTRLLTFRPRWIDLPMIVWCICPFLSSIHNDLGIYDGCSAVLYQTIDWGIPYFIGRVYFSDFDGVQELAVGIFMGGLAYVPFCLYEIRMSPQLHTMIYGFYQHDFAQTIRFGGWRPTVFMEHGLAVGLWMAMASLLGVWLVFSGVVKNILGLNAVACVVLLLITTVLCKSTGATILLATGLAVLFAGRYLRTRLVFVALLLIAPAYMAFRSSSVWDGSTIVALSKEWVGPDRAESLAFRIRNEDMLAAKAFQQPIVGWGRWGRARVYDETGRDISVTDGFWVITLGACGILGLTTVTLVLLLPASVLARRIPPVEWAKPQYAAPVAMGVMLGLYMIDNLSNAMINPIFILSAGGVSGYLLVRTAPKSTKVPSPALGGKTSSLIPGDQRIPAVAVAPIRHGLYP